MKDSQRETRWFLTALLLIFITLKLIGKITWSWWWVLSPFWIPFALAAVLIAILRPTLMIGRSLETPEQRNRRELVEALDDFAGRFRKR